MGTGWDQGYGWLRYVYVLKGLAVEFWSLFRAESIGNAQFQWRQLRRGKKQGDHERPFVRGRGCQRKGNGDNMIELGSRGTDVQALQLQLRALGYEVGDVDGIFGNRTLGALTAFQNDYESLAPSGKLDEQTAAALAQALVIKGIRAEQLSDELPPPIPCEAETWARFMDLVGLITKTPVCYGPGRGLYRDGAWVVTYGPGDLALKKWPSATGKTYPSFHCSSWTNFFLGWLLRYNERYTHAGNIPSLFDLCEQSDELHPQADGGPYRGYGPYCRVVKSDGSTAARTGIPKVLDIRELFDRRAELPTFIVCGQSTLIDNKWKWWHHTVLFVIDHSSPDHPLYRLAADGYYGTGGWSARPMRWLTIDEQTMPTYLGSVIYRGYAVVTEDGTYGDSRATAPVTIEP